MKRSIWLPIQPVVLFAVFSTILLSMISCEQKGDQIKRNYSLETAKMVSEAPSSIISSDQNIAVVFVDKMVKKSQVGVALKK
ncbi:MAG: hypothetical protein P8X42_06700, partial [Calditrichaceae bacterium]